MEAVARAFAEHARLVTVLGPAGIGKTRFALRFVEMRAESIARACHVADLTEASEEVEVALAVARACRLDAIGTRDPIGAVGDALAAPPSVLLVLDNCEQAVEVVASLVASWVRRAPNLSVLTTSRARLGLQGEHVYELPPLDVETEAMELFVDRAKLADPHFSPSMDDLDTLRRIARALEGIPLALHLAAARAH